MTGPGDSRVGVQSLCRTGNEVKGSLCPHPLPPKRRKSAPARILELDGLARSWRITPEACALPGNALPGSEEATQAREEKQQRKVTWLEGGGRGRDPHLPKSAWALRGPSRSWPRGAVWKWGDGGHSGHAPSGSRACLPAGSILPPPGKPLARFAPRPRPQRCVAGLPDG